jgi:xanthine dehydrogenase accessory factor
MGFDLAELSMAVARHGRVVRVVIAQVRGSSPREVGAAMLVWAGDRDGGQSGTIGGGALEHQATEAARRMLATGAAARLTRHALGPNLGQCCGGAVQLLAEVYDAGKLADLQGQDVIARPVIAGVQMPLTVQRVLTRARGQGDTPIAQLIDGWMIEPLERATVPLWIWGAGHVGRAFVAVMAPLPDLAITWIDTGSERFPDAIPAQVTALPAADPARLVPHAPRDAHHLILTYSHALDLALCHAVLEHGFASAGLIGSATKWARFRARLGDLGHSPAQIARIRCPIGTPGLGKHPQAIAIGVASSLLSDITAMSEQRERSA